MGRILLAGLGNPGVRYGGTRHNTGFMLAESIGSSFKVSGSLPFCYSETEKITVIKPLTFMNRSGIAVRAAAEYFKFSYNDILVACDDFNLPPGKLRLRGKGSSGGHNGIKSIIDSLGTDEFPRLRMGIGGESEPDKIEFVLEEFKSSEKEMLEEMLIDSVKLVRYYTEHGLEETMNKFN